MIIIIKEGKCEVLDPVSKSMFKSYKKHNTLRCEICSDKLVKTRE